VAVWELVKAIEHHLDGWLHQGEEAAAAR